MDDKEKSRPVDRGTVKYVKGVHLRSFHLAVWHNSQVKGHVSIAI